MAETKNLPGFILTLILLGMIIGVGLIVLINFGDSARTTTTQVNNSITLLRNQWVSLTYDELSSFTSLKNSTSYTIPAANYTVDTTNGRIMLLAQKWNNTAAKATYGYYVDSTTTTAMDNISSAVTPIATTWIALIVTVFVLAIILGLVITSFGGR